MFLGIQLVLQKQELQAQSRCRERTRQGMVSRRKGGTQPNMEYFLELVLTLIDVQQHSDSAIIL